MKNKIFTEVWLGEKIPSKFRVNMRRVTTEKTMLEAQVFGNFSLLGSKAFIPYTVPENIQSIIKGNFAAHTDSYFTYNNRIDKAKMNTFINFKSKESDLDWTPGHDFKNQFELMGNKVQFRLPLFTIIIYDISEYELWVYEYMIIMIIRINK